MPHYVDRDFEWDIDKSEATYELRGFDFHFASRLFEDPHYRERLEDRDFGEERIVSNEVVDEDGPRSGRIDRSKVNALTQDEIEEQAGREFAALGLGDNLGKPYTVCNSPSPDIKQLRDTLKCSQREFAERFGLSLRTVQQWEQGRSIPDQPARILLTTIETNPDAVARAASVAISRARDRRRCPA